jgi:outer membrane protein assembly complex protein YaeT
MMTTRHRSRQKETAISRRRLLAAALAGAMAVVAQEPAATPPPAGQSGKSNVLFVGITHFDGAQLRTAIADQITEMDEGGVNAASADDAAFFLGIFYRKNGYADVNVNSKVLGPRAVELDVTEGSLTLLGDVRFPGAAGLQAETLEKILTSATRDRFPNPKVPLPYVQADVDAGVEQIRGRYASEGFLDAVVDPATVKFAPDKSQATVVVTVHEGTQYHFGQIHFTGDLVFYPNTELLNELKPFTSKPYTPAQVTNMQRAVVYYYKTHGYYDPKVDAQSDPKKAAGGNVPVSFDIESGAVYRFGGVSQEGLDRLSQKFLPDRFASLKGKFYNPEKLDEKFREMMQTGLFRQLRIEPRPLPDNTIELHLKVDEEKAREIGFSAGYGTFEGPIIGVVAGDRDLFGTGRALTANVELSANILKGEILYSDPWFLESDFAFQTRVYGQSEDWYRYNVLETGIRPQISRQLTKELQAAVFAQGKQVTVTDEGIDEAVLGPTSYFVGSTGASLTLDTRSPDKLNPRKGFIGDVIGEVATSGLGSKVDFVRATGRATYYIPTTSRTLLALGARAGWMQAISGNPNDIPIAERFFNGGSTSVRSFPERRLGPSDWHGYTIGGDVFTTFNAEFQFPLYGPVIGAVFADAGSVGPDPGSIGEMRYGVGPGIRYASPVGPLRIDLGINPNRETGERRMMIHISFGMAF